MKPLLSVEFFKLRKRMMTWVLAFILVGLIVLIYSVLWNISGKATTFGDQHQYTAEDLRRALFIQNAIPFSLQIVGTFGVILAVILAAGAVGSEYSWGTIRLMSTAASGRLRFLIAKLVIVFSLVVLGAALAMVVATSYAAVITWTSGGSSLDFLTGSYALDQLESIGRVMAVAGPYVCLAFSMAVLGRSTLAGAGAGIGLAFMEPLIAGLMRLGDEPWKSVPDYFMNANAQIVLLQNSLPGVLPRFGAGEESKRNVHSVEEAFLILAIYSAVFIGVAFFAYRRRDITA